jgi:hypothetical protein
VLQGDADALRKRQDGRYRPSAMIFLVLFATLAVGFYASTTQTAVIATNEKTAWFRSPRPNRGWILFAISSLLLKCRRRCRWIRRFDYVASHLQDALRHRQSGR